MFKKKSVRGFLTTAIVVIVICACCFSTAFSTLSTEETGEQNNDAIENEKNNNDNESISSSNNTNRTSNVSSTTQSNNSTERTTTSGDNTVESGRVDTRLSSIHVNCGELVPDFDPDIYEYTVYVEKNGETKNCGTSVEAMDNSVSITAEGPLEFTDEDVVKKIIVTGPNSERSEYVINVHVVSEGEMIVGKNLYKLTSTPDLSLLPEGFESTTLNIMGIDTVAAKSSDGNLIMLQYANATDENDLKWYRFEPSTETIYPVEVVDINGEKSIIISSGKDFIYGKSGDEQGYYIYDEDQDSVEIFIDQSAGESVLSGEATHTGVIIFIMALVLIAALVLCAVLYLRLKQEKKKKKNSKNVRYFGPHLSLDEKTDKKTEQ